MNNTFVKLISVKENFPKNRLIQTKKGRLINTQAGGEYRRHIKLGAKTVAFIIYSIDEVEVGDYFYSEEKETIDLCVSKRINGHFNKDGIRFRDVIKLIGISDDHPEIKMISINDFKLMINKYNNNQPYKYFKLSNLKYNDNIIRSYCNDDKLTYDIELDFIPIELSLKMINHLNFTGYFYGYHKNEFLGHKEIRPCRNYVPPSSLNKEVYNSGAILYQQAFDFIENRYGLTGVVKRNGAHSGLSPYWWYLITDEFGDEIFDWQSRYTLILQESSQDIPGDHLDLDKFSELMYKYKFAFKSSKDCANNCLEKMINHLLPNNK